MSFFKSEQIQTNLHDIFETYQDIASMTSKLGSMSKQEKLDHIEDCKVLIDKQRTFYGRLCLAASEDTEAADMRTQHQRTVSGVWVSGSPRVYGCNGGDT